jgi:hypothetical protein
MLWLLPRDRQACRNRRWTTRWRRRRSCAALPSCVVLCCGTVLTINLRVRELMTDPSSTPPQPGGALGSYSSTSELKLTSIGIRQPRRHSLGEYCRKRTSPCSQVGGSHEPHATNVKSYSCLAGRCDFPLCLAARFHHSTLGRRWRPPEGNPPCVGTYLWHSQTGLRIEKWLQGSRILREISLM